LADTWEWLLLSPWDPKLDNFRIGEHTFSEGAGGLKPKTVYRSTFNIGKKNLIAYGKVRCKKRIYSIVVSPRKYLERRAVKNIINPPQSPPRNKNAKIKSFLQVTRRN